jgi:hypothetical protein
MKNRVAFCRKRRTSNLSHFWALVRRCPIPRPVGLRTGSGSRPRYDDYCSFRQDSNSAWALSRGAPEVRSNLHVFAENSVSRPTVWTPQRKLKCAQPPHLSLRGFNVTADHSSRGRTMIDQHEFTPSLRPRRASVAPSGLRESQWYHCILKMCDNGVNLEAPSGGPALRPCGPGRR